MLTFPQHVPSYFPSIAHTSQDSGSSDCSLPRAGITSMPTTSTISLASFNIHLWFLLNHYDCQIIIFSGSATSCVFIHSLVRSLLSHLSVIYSQIKFTLSFETRSCQTHDPPTAMSPSAGINCIDSLWAISNCLSLMTTSSPTRHRGKKSGWLLTFL